MDGSKYAIGVDFGTESGRAVLIETKTGKEIAGSVYYYQNGVIDEQLPVEGHPITLEPEWALQDPEDYIRTFQKTIPDVLAQAGIQPEEVIGIGIDFTACTILPVKSDGTPLCTLPEYRRNPHSWVKLWKHHAAQPEADKINATARRLGEPWLDRYGGKISSEWFFSKTLQILDEAPDIYEAADRLIEAADWVVWQLTGVEKRNSCTAGYKAMWSKREGYPPNDYFKALDPRLENVVDRRQKQQVEKPTSRPGRADCGDRMNKNIGRVRQPVEQNHHAPENPASGANVSLGLPLKYLDQREDGERTHRYEDHKCRGLVEED